VTAAIAAVLIIGYSWRPALPQIATAVAIAVSVEETSAASRASLLDASGYVIARRRATVASKITGKVVEILLEEGQRVESGQVIARLDDSNAKAALAQSEAQVREAEAAVASAQTAYDDAEPIFERNRKEKTAAVISAQSFDEARAQIDRARSELLVAQGALESARAGCSMAQRSLDDTVVRAPFSGIVTEKSAQAGEMVSPVSAGSGFTRTGIGTVVDMNSLEVEVDVSENFIERVRPHQPVRIKLNAYPEWDIPGTVIATIPTADRAKATVKVRIAIDQTDSRILPEMGAHVSFLSDSPRRLMNGSGASRSRSIVIPAEAIAMIGATNVVYVIHGSTVERRVVQLGARIDAGQIVSAGLEAGSTIAIGDLSRLRDGMRIRVPK
jgi:RND family efflux transporter MFP subunit